MLLKNELKLEKTENVSCVVKWQKVGGVNRHLKNQKLDIFSVKNDITALKTKTDNNVILS